MKACAILFFLIWNISLYAQSNCEGCQDYPLLPRMPEYHISGYQAAEFSSEEFKYDKETHVIEGKKIQIRYKHNHYSDKEFAFPSRLQILKNYANAIKKAGGKVLHENAAQGHYNFNASNGKQIWVKVLPSYSGKDYRLEIIEEEAMRQDIVISADLIKSKIDSDGKATLQGIFFDTGKATLRDESEPALQEIAKYLKENPSVQCWVVGHTDSDGSLYINSKLSLDRAMAVKNELENKFNIKQGRLSAKGVGPLAPVASNKTEEGKQQNRRVELVLI